MDWPTFFSAIAAAIALAALIKSYFDSESRQKWEADQTTRRETFEKRLNDRQHDWQRQQESQRQTEREEDLTREKQRDTPRLRVIVAQGYRMWGQNYIHTLIIKARNVGQVPVFIEAPQFKDLHGDFINTIFEQTVSIHNWPTANISMLTFPLMLNPTQSHEVLWVREQLIDYLRQQRLGKFEIQAVVQDGTGTGHYSDIVPININEDSFSMTLPKPA